MNPQEQKRRKRTRADRAIRRHEVKHQTGLSDSALDREIRAGRFPKPFKLSSEPNCRAVAWSEEAVQAWIAERIASNKADAA